MERKVSWLPSVLALAGGVLAVVTAVVYVQVMRDQGDSPLVWVLVVLAIFSIGLPLLLAGMLLVVAGAIVATPAVSR